MHHIYKKNFSTDKQSEMKKNSKVVPKVVYYPKHYFNSYFHSHSMPM